MFGEKTPIYTIFFRIFLYIDLYLNNNIQFQFSSIKMKTVIRLKILVLGNSQSGKTSFINKLVENQPTNVYKKTQNYQVTLYTLQTMMNIYEVQLWDCGSEHLLSNKFIRNAFFKNASAGFILFDLSDFNWKQNVTSWIQECYKFDCFLVYAIATKKDLMIEKLNSQSKERQLLKQSLLTSHNKHNSLKHLQHPESMMLYEMNINDFFNQFQIKHFYAAHKQKIPFEIRNIFITIHDDREKLSRSSLARGIRFDNTIVDEYIKKMQMRDNKKIETEALKSVYEQEQFPKAQY